MKKFAIAAVAVLMSSNAFALEVTIGDGSAINIDVPSSVSATVDSSVSSSVSASVDQSGGFNEAMAKAEAQAAHEAELAAAGIEVMDSVEALVEAAANEGSYAIDEAVVDAMGGVEALNEQLDQALENHADNAEAIADGVDVGGKPGGPIPAS